MKNNFLIFLITCLFCLCLGLPVLSAGLGSAGGVFKQIGSQAGADTYQTPQDLIGVGINAALTLVGLFFLVLMIYAGYLWLTARGEEEPINKAKKIITSTIIGFVLVASAYSITVFVGKRFEEAGGGGMAGDLGADVPEGDPNQMVCCRICEGKTLEFCKYGNGKPDYKWLSAAGCSGMISTCESQGDCKAVIIDPAGISEEKQCNNTGDGGFLCEEYDKDCGEEE